MLLKDQNLEPVVEYASVRLITELLCHSECNKHNPTIPQLVEHIVNCIAHEQPLKIFATQPIQESEEVHYGRCHYYLSRPPRAANIDHFVQQVPLTSWEKLRFFALDLKYPVQLEILLDDMHFHCCEEWCDDDSLVRLDAELEVYHRQLQKRAESFFGSEVATVRRWSDLYGAERYLLMLRHARDFSNWRKGDHTNLIETSLEMHCDVWGYRKLSHTLGLSRGDIARLIIESVAGLAAHNRLKANIADESRAVMLWSESQHTNPLWHVILSNYDGEGYAPSLVMGRAA